MAVVEPEATPLTPVVASPEPVAEEAPHQLRSEDGSLSPAPAFLQVARPEPLAEDGEPRPRSRRRRTPRSFEPNEGEAPAAPETEEA
jgi:hypothetical protein